MQRSTFATQVFLLALGASLALISCGPPEERPATLGESAPVNVPAPPSSATAAPGAPEPAPFAEGEEPLVLDGTSGQPGGQLLVALRAEPATFNPVLATSRPSRTVIRRLMADLISINRFTQRTEPALAASWTVSPDGRIYTLDLRPGTRFSDGHLLDADDILFTFAVYLDPEVASPNRDLLIVDGEPIQARKLGPLRVELTAAEPHAVGDRLFDSLAILPEHRLGTAWREGRFRETWGLATAPEEIVGLGPYRLSQYLPGERLELERNPYYWKADGDGRRLPYLDRLTFLFVKAEEARLLRFEKGQIHLFEPGAEVFGELHTAASPDLQLSDVGAGLRYELLFFNLNDLPSGAAFEASRSQAWFRKEGFRRALSAALDRESISRLVYRGFATPILSPVTPGNKLWHAPRFMPPPASLEHARELLREAGFSHDAEGRLVDDKGAVVSFTLVTNSSNPSRVRTAAIVQDDLKQLGIEVKVVPLEFQALLDRVTESFEYEAVLLGFSSGDADPNGDLDVWTSGGNNHLWRLRAGTLEPWQVEIDRLLREQLSVIDPAARQQMHLRVQELIVEHLPAIPLVSTNVLAGAHRALGNFQPAILSHSTLWNADRLYWRTAEPSAR